jgi:hypothetical protein
VVVEPAETVADGEAADEVAVVAEAAVEAGDAVEAAAESAATSDPDA